MYKFLLLAGVSLVLAGCASKEKDPPYLMVDPTVQIVSDVYIRYAGSTQEIKSLGGAAYRQSEIIFSLNEAEELDVPTPEREVTTAVAVPKPAKVKHVSSQPKAKPPKSKPTSKPRSTKPKTPCPAPADPCPPVQVIIKETTYCNKCQN